MNILLMAKFNNIFADIIVAYLVLLIQHWFSPMHIIVPQLPLSNEYGWSVVFKTETGQFMCAHVDHGALCTNTTTHCGS